MADPGGWSLPHHTQAASGTRPASSYVAECECQGQPQKRRQSLLQGPMAPVSRHRSPDTPHIYIKELHTRAQSGHSDASLA